MKRASAEPAGPKKTFLVVVTPTGHEYWDAQSFRPHQTGDGTLQIQREQTTAMVTLYSPIGWLKYTWVLAYPVQVDDLRVDGLLPF